MWYSELELDTTPPLTMVEYTMMCTILGDNKLFSVEINNDKQVSALKNKIIPADLIRAAALKWYKINTLVPNYKMVIDSISLHTIKFNEGDKLADPFCKLSTIQDGFPQGNLHILVEIPASESFSSRPGHDVTETPLGKHSSPVNSCSA